MSSLTQNAFQIEPVRSQDARELVVLQQRIYDEERWFVGDGPPTPEALSRRLRSLVPQRSCYLVVRASQLKELCAWLELHRLQPKRLEHVAVLTLAVAAPYRRKGLAKGLLQRGLSWAERQGVRKISLNVRVGNRAAVALYAGFGFAIEGRERKHIWTRDGFEDNLIMAKWLEVEHG